MAFMAVLLILLLIAAMVFTFGFILSDRRAANLSPLLRKVRDFLKMKKLYLEKVLRGLYVFITVLVFVLCVGGGVLLVPAVMVSAKAGFGTVLLGIIGGLLGGVILAAILLFIIRISYESTMLKISLTKAAKSLESKFCGDMDDRAYEEPRRRPRTAAPAPRPAVCERCGTRFDPRRGYCPNCGERW